ncbi:transposase [Pseudomonas sp.]
MRGCNEPERYSEELKNGAIELVIEQGPSVAGVAARLGMWRRSR